MRLSGIIIITLLLAGCAADARRDDPPIFSRAREAGVAGSEAFASGDYRRALEKFALSLSMHRSLDDRQGAAMDLVNIGRTCLASGAVDEALPPLVEAESLSRELKDDRVLSESLASKAKALYQKGDSAAALSAVEESLQIDSKMGYITGLKLNLKAEILLGLGEKGKAGALFRDALAINRRGADRTEEANSLRGLARLALEAGRHPEAGNLYGEAYGIDRAIGDPLKIAEDLDGMAEMEIKEGRTSEALSLLERSYLAALNGGYGERALSSIDRIIDIHQKAGDASQAGLFMKIRESVLAGKRAGGSGKKR